MTAALGDSGRKDRRQKPTLLRYPSLKGPGDLTCFLRRLRTTSLPAAAARASKMRECRSRRLPNSGVGIPRTWSRESISLPRCWLAPCQRGEEGFQPIPGSQGRVAYDVRSLANMLVLRPMDCMQVVFDSRPVLGFAAFYGQPL